MVFINASHRACPPKVTRDILGILIENTEGAKFGMKVFNNMKLRGCNDVFI